MKDDIENSKPSKMTSKQKLRENRAVETIIACIIRGFTKKDWKRVFKRMDEKARQKKISDKDHRDSHQHDTYGK